MRRRAIRSGYVQLLRHADRPRYPSSTGGHMSPTATRRRTSPEGFVAPPAPARGTTSTRPSARPPVRKRPGDPLWARLALILGALLMMVSGGVIVGGKVLIGKVSGGIEQRNLLGTAGAKRVAIDGPLNLLLVGVDQRPEN